MTRQSHPQSPPSAAPKADKIKSVRRSPSPKDGENQTAKIMALLNAWNSTTPDLDDCIGKAQRARVEMLELLNGMAKEILGSDSGRKPLPQQLRREPASKQFRDGDTKPLDPFSVLLPELSSEHVPDGGLQSADARIAELLDILWADIRLWKSVAKKLPPQEIAADIHRWYGLQFPEIPVAAWNQMVRQPQKRKILFNLLHIGFGTEADNGSIQELNQKLPPKLAGKLLYEYLLSPGSTHSNLLASQEFSPAALACLRKAAVRLCEGISWCEKHPGLIPPTLAPAARHRPKEVARARTIEQMVKRLLDNPALSDYGLAGKNASNRKLAAEARQLVELREGQAVERYSELRDGKVIGRKPRRLRKIRPGR
jgi:hypothetical protein